MLEKDGKRSTLVVVVGPPYIKGIPKEVIERVA